MFWAVPLPIIRSSFTVHLALVHVIRFEVSLCIGLPQPCAKCTLNELLMMGRGTA